MGGLFVSLVFGLSIFGISGLDTTREPIFMSNGGHWIFLVLGRGTLLGLREGQLFVR